MLNSEGKEICWICGVVLEYKKTDNPNVIKQITPHKKWCVPLGDKIINKFERTFAEIFNVIELALDKDKADKAKGLIGRTIVDTRNGCIDIIRDYMNNKL